MIVSETVSPWDLWILRGFDPTATEADVVRLTAARRLQSRWESALFQRILAGDVSPLLAGRRLLAARPELTSGVILTMHLGPFQFVLEPFVAAGLRLHLLINQDAARRLRPVAARLAEALRHRGELVWHHADDPACVRGLLRALRSGEPILAFADGNQGRDGLAGTRRHGAPYELPGREIRVRTGLARFVCRTGCPVHPLSVRWSDDGREVLWRTRPGQQWSPGDDPLAVTRRLFDWVFAEVAAAPAQWSYWPMLGETAGCFADQASQAAVPMSLHADYRRAFTLALARAADTARVHLDAELAVWPGDVLVDLSRDHFYAAAGLVADDLALFGDRPPTLASLVNARGAAWVTEHVLRLCLLGLAHLSGDEVARAV
ncbi:MAG: hypothetical protein R3D98_01635 [Candidatus Krumholzibacteriia bacterium]